MKEMKVLAISCEGKEYMYIASSARKVSEQSSSYIRKVVNENNYLLKPGQVWYVHYVDEYDSAYDYAMHQAFRVRKGIVTDVKY